MAWGLSKESAKAVREHMREILNGKPTFGKPRTKRALADDAYIYVVQAAPLPLILEVAQVGLLAIAAEELRRQRVRVGERPDINRYYSNPHKTADGQREWLYVDFFSCPDKKVRQSIRDRMSKQGHTLLSVVATMDWMEALVDETGADTPMQACNLKGVQIEMFEDADTGT